ncbi:hypothetical protein WJX84_006504 [Apatococcus fuscideae]|uniref:Fe2OG dioxygenase domain-containing protein n=1 Tax=Apatococcus fuscideae TaxID=2026836 RepID=A0AAW1RTR9_9CHLO
MVSIDIKDILARARRPKQNISTANRDLSAALEVLNSKAVAQSRLTLQTLASKKLQGLAYVPDFITTDEEQALLTCMRAAQGRPWVEATGRRIQNWGGQPGRAETEELPAFLQTLVRRLVAAGVYAPQDAPNHCLINEYTNGSGIPAHDDGPLYVPPVATISLGGSAVINFVRQTSPDSQPELITKVLLQQGCLLLVDGQAYTAAMHEIPSQDSDVIDEHCCNAGLAKVSIGDVIRRPQCRLSLVLVHKRTS